ncbi:MAG: hypothetical protein PHH40_00555 [Candidatus Moranbacteria bacterium]|nr:hypothetical protein [Candidatus Moranbacteria bacterium]MDD3964803.1 hypothetical protein [Candidatus Moranbacteria bacterium]
MYWIYLAIFIFIVFVPKIIQTGYFFFQEEDIESLILFFFGIFIFILYFSKERTLLHVFQEKLHLQKKTNIVTKDLSDSYSYIGGLNRKFDIVKDFIFHIPEDTADVLLSKKQETYRSVLNTVKILAKSKSISLRFVNVKKKTIETVVEVGKNDEFHLFTAQVLLKSKKKSLEKNGYAIVQSPSLAHSMTAFLIFPKLTNQIEDVEMFKILASQALLLFCINKYILPNNDTLPPTKKK